MKLLLKQTGQEDTKNILMAQDICIMVGCSEHCNKPPKCHKRPRTSWLTERLLALKGRVCSTKLLKLYFMFE